MIPLIGKDTPAREAFAILLAAKRAMKYPGRDHPVQQEFLAAVVEAAKAKHSKKRKISRRKGFETMRIFLPVVNWVEAGEARELDRHAADQRDQQRPGHRAAEEGEGQLQR